MWIPQNWCRKLHFISGVFGFQQFYQPEPWRLQSWFTPCSNWMRASSVKTWWKHGPASGLQQNWYFVLIYSMSSIGLSKLAKNYIGIFLLKKTQRLDVFKYLVLQIMSTPSAIFMVVVELFLVQFDWTWHLHVVSVNESDFVWLLLHGSFSVYKADNSSSAVFCVFLQNHFHI